MKELMTVGIGYERLFFFIIMFLILCHIVSCLFILVCSFEEDDEQKWINHLGSSDLPHSELYLSSFYFTVTTITTVGYGDITAKSKFEQIFCILVMIIGVISFSFASGSLASIL